MTSPRILEESGLALDANEIGVTPTIDIDGRTIVSFGIYSDAGAHATHVVTLQCSLDGTNWHNVTDASITGIGIVGSVTVGTRYVRLKVSTAEGASSTIDWILQAKG